MRNRIMGEEIEWTGGCRLGAEGVWNSIGSHFDQIASFVLSEYENTQNTLIFLPNGARVYNETTGYHLETALPECQSAVEVLKFDKWSEWFACRVSKKIKENNNIDSYFFKKNTDSNMVNTEGNRQNTRGCHENYLSEKIFGKLLTESEVRLRAVDKTLIHPEINYFILFLITRQIFTGSGGIMLYSGKGGEDTYEISPRTNYIDAVLTTSTTTAGKPGRAIINIRPETLVGNDTYWRNHLILGDANMADLSIFLKFGTTSAVIEMIEEGTWNDDLCLDNPADAPDLLKRISKDLTLENVPIRLKNGKDYTALQIQKKFCKNWRRYVTDTRQGGEKFEVSERWREVLDRLEIDDEVLYSQLDYKIKKRLVEGFADKKGVPLGHESIINVDNMYHNPDPEKSFYYKLKNRPGSNFVSLITESEIMAADRTPPNTRAKLRVALKKIIDKLHVTHSVVINTVDWHLIGFQLNLGGFSYHILMHDPRLSSFSSLNSEENLEAIKCLNKLRPGAIII